MNVQEIVEKLNLLPHPEGGFYKETYRSEGQISQGSLNENFSGKRSYCTAIYFLLTKDKKLSYMRSGECIVKKTENGSTEFKCKYTFITRKRRDYSSKCRRGIGTLY